MWVAVGGRRRLSRLPSPWCLREDQKAAARCDRRGRTCRAAMNLGWVGLGWVGVGWGGFRGGFGGRPNLAEADQRLAELVGFCGIRALQSVDHGTRGRVDEEDRRHRGHGLCAMCNTRRRSSTRSTSGGSSTSAGGIHSSAYIISGPHPALPCQCITTASFIVLLEHLRNAAKFWASVEPWTSRSPMNLAAFIRAWTCITHGGGGGASVGQE